MELNKNKIFKWIIIFIGLIILLIIYSKYNPIESNLFPKCPFKTITGYKCPGCGSQRAIHYLLNGDIISAVKQNMLLVLSIPYIIIGIIFDSISINNNKLLKIRKSLFGTTAIYIIFTIVILFWILRNFTVY